MSGRADLDFVWVLAVDFGTTATAAAVREPDGRVTGLVLSDGTSTMPSSVLADPTGVLVGTKADSAAGYSLDRYQPTPKRDIGRASVLLGESEFRPCTLIAAVYAAVIGEAVRQHNHRPPEKLVLTHPVDWSDRRLDVLREAVSLAGTQLGISLPDPTFMPEPVAAATHYARLEPSDDERTARSATFTDSAAAATGDQAGDQFFAVYDLGGGTFDATVLCLSSDGFEVLATGGIDPLGGFEFDNRLFNYFGRTHYRKADPKLWQALAQPDAEDPDSGMRRRFLDATVRQVKEELSEHTQRTVRLPGLSEPVLVTRTEFENLIRSDLDATIAEFEATLARAGLTADQLAGIYRIGGSSRIPLVGRLLDQFQRPVHVVDHPKTVVALGAAVESGVADEPHVPTAPLTTAPGPGGRAASVSPRQLLVDEVTALHRSEKWQEVVAKADELARLDPGDPDPGGMVADARARLRQADLANRYAQGVELLQKAQWREAIRAFTAIEQEQPSYRDTSALIRAAQKLDETKGSDQVPAVETSPPIDSPSLITGSRATQAWPPLFRRASRRTRFAVLAGALALAVVIAAVVIVGLQSTQRPRTAQTPQPSTPARQITYLPQAELPFTGLNRPVGVAVDGAGTLYVADTSNNRVLKLVAGDTTQTVLPFTGLNGPVGVAVDAAGTLYVTDYGNNRVLKLAAGDTTQTVLPFTVINGFAASVAVDGAGTLYVTTHQSNLVLKLAAGDTTQTVLPFTGLNEPDGVAVDAAGNIYVADQGNNRVLKLAAGDTTQTVLPFTGLDKAGGVAVDAAGNIYVTGNGNNRVLKLAAGDTSQVELPFTGLVAPYGVAVDAAGNIYVADRGNDRVLKLPAG